MLDQEAMQIARTRLSSESSRRHHFFYTDLQRVQSELVAKGLGRSSALIQAISDVCAKEVENSTDRLWEIVGDLLQEEDAAISPEAVGALHRQIDELWVPYCSALPEQQFEAICQRDGVGSSAGLEPFSFELNSSRICDENDRLSEPQHRALRWQDIRWVQCLR